MIEDIPEDVLNKTKYIVLSYPSNPVGASAPKEMYVKMIEYAKKYNFAIINDNAYSDIILTAGKVFILSLPGAKMWELSFLTFKSYNVTGLRISFCIGNKSIIDAFKLLRSQYDLVCHIRHRRRQSRP